MTATTSSPSWTNSKVQKQLEEFRFDNCLVPLNVIDRHRHSTDERTGIRFRKKCWTRRVMTVSEQVSWLVDDISYAKQSVWTVDFGLDLSSSGVECIIITRLAFSDVKLETCWMNFVRCLEGYPCLVPVFLSKQIKNQVSWLPFLFVA